MRNWFIAAESRSPGVEERKITTIRFSQLCWLIPALWCPSQAGASDTCCETLAPTAAPLGQAINANPTKSPFLAGHRFLIEITESGAEFHVYCLDAPSISHDSGLLASGNPCWSGPVTGALRIALGSADLETKNSVQKSDSNTRVARFASTNFSEKLKLSFTLSPDYRDAERPTGPLVEAKLATAGRSRPEMCDPASGRPAMQRLAFNPNSGPWFVPVALNDSHMLDREPPADADESDVQNARPENTRVASNSDRTDESSPASPGVQQNNETGAVTTPVIFDDPIVATDVAPKKPAGAGDGGTGERRQPQSSETETSPTKDASTASSPVPPTRVEIPKEKIWSIRPDVSLRQTLMDWATRIGWIVVWDADTDYEAVIGTHFVGEFADAVVQLFNAFPASIPLRAELRVSNVPPVLVVTKSRRPLQ